MIKINFAADPAIPEHLFRAVFDGMREVLEIAGIIDVSCFSLLSFRDEKSFMYLQRAYQPAICPDSLNATSILLDCMYDPQRTGDYPLEIFLVPCTIFSAEGKDNAWPFGYCFKLTGLVISCYAFTDLSPVVGYEYLKTAAMHEVTHLLCSPRVGRDSTVEISGTHCTNRCIMRQNGNNTNLDEMVRDRLNHGAFCQQCETELKQLSSFKDGDKAHT